MGKKNVKIRESEFEIKKDKNSTIFSDPKKKEQPDEANKKPKKKWVPVIIIAIICLVIVLPWGIVKMINDGREPGRNIDPISKRSQVVLDKNISEKAVLLYECVNHDPTNIKANDHIAGLLGVTTYCGKHQIEVYQNDSGYTMRFAFEKPHSTSTNNEFYDLMLNYTIAFMALVDDITAVEWTCPAVDSNSTNTSEKITLDNIKEYLNDSPKEYIKSTRTVQFMLNEHGLNYLSD